MNTSLPAARLGSPDQTREVRDLLLGLDPTAPTPLDTELGGAPFVRELIERYPRTGDAIELVLSRGRVTVLEIARIRPPVAEGSQRRVNRIMAIDLRAVGALRRALRRLEDVVHEEEASKPRGVTTRTPGASPRKWPEPPKGPQPSKLQQRKAAALRRGDRRQQPVPVAPAIVEEEGDDEPILPRRGPELAAAGNGRY